MSTAPANPPPMIPLHGLTEAIHISESEVPFVDTGDGGSMQLLQVDLNQGLWILRTRMPPGRTITKHYHTGSVFAVTLKGRWFYKEYPSYVNAPGSYLYEPAGSVHTLMTPKDQEGITDVWFAARHRGHLQRGRQCGRHGRCCRDSQNLPDALRRAGALGRQGDRPRRTQELNGDGAMARPFRGAITTVSTWSAASFDRTRFGF